MKKNNRLLYLFYGGLSGLLTGLIFALLWSYTNVLATTSFLVVLSKVQPSIAREELFGLTPTMAVYLFHFFVSLFLGVAFALIFSNKIKKFQHGIEFGSLFGIIWWIVTPLYLLPFFFLVPPSIMWDVFLSFTFLNALIGHILFGMTIGIIYFWFKKLFLIK